MAEGEAVSIDIFSVIVVSVLQTLLIAWWNIFEVRYYDIMLSEWGWWHPDSFKLQVVRNFNSSKRCCPGLAGSCHALNLCILVSSLSPQTSPHVPTHVSLPQRTVHFPFARVLFHLGRTSPFSPIFVLRDNIKKTAGQYLLDFDINIWRPPVNDLLILQFF